MNFVGYFPGIDFSSDDQFGRKIHLKEFISNVASNRDVTGTFVLGNAASADFPDEVTVLEAGYTSSIGGQVVNESRQVANLYDLVRTQDLELIYTRDSPYFAPLLVSLLSDTPLVVEANGVPEEEGDQSILGRAKKQPFHQIRSLKRRRASKIISVSESITDHLLTQYPNASVVTVPNGVDVTTFDITNPVTEGEPYSVCYVGGLQEWQEVGKMIRVLALVDMDIDFTVVGGREERRRSLRAVAEREGVDENVEFVGKVPHARVPEIINANDVCLGPFAQSRRASPLKIYEYLACGREVIIVNDEGLENTDQLPGVHRFPYESNERLANRISDVLRQVSTNREGRNEVVDRHSWEAAVERVMDECEKVAR